MTSTNSNNIKRRRLFGFGKRGISRNSKTSNQDRINDEKRIHQALPDVIQKIIAASENPHQVDEERQDSTGDMLVALTTRHSKDDELLYRLCREATEACLRAIISHLDNFIQNCDNCDAKYEDWIRDVHPENVDGFSVDHRFYIKESEHLLIWNALMEALNKQSHMVSPRSLLQLQQHSKEDGECRQ